jgi:2-keto-4-pentenoate hydratase
MLAADVNTVAQALLDARVRSRMCEFPDQFRGRPKTEAEGYILQEAHVSLLTGHYGGGLIGYKAGFITKGTRDQFGGIARLGMDSPTYGSILAKFVFESRAVVPFRDLLRPSVECELAVRIGRDIPPTENGYTRDTIAPYVEHFMAGIELVDFHIPFMSFSPPLGPLMLADNCCNWGNVIGAPIARWRDLDLPKLRGELRQDGRLIEGGIGAALAGHPLEVVVGLENHLLESGSTLRAGQILMLGSVILNYPVTKPCEITVDWDVFGRATVIFE